ncbi:hypothetical protein BKP37_17320 [Anaerobacillus alkalilacustris]|uniref:Sporulation protein n=1 Tax=Anaerobacillus alkalilacustris TaxID=393763 RepID=A0A1S2LEU3_9BACI|nr:YhcN/YlaJ family sporulation lipoprotein [Anaerobacillus alkalilacustris]OIJ10760.1 hypothetical protein BKP37_17320 [Anaerobacillus alkalilacustris]
MRKKFIYILIILTITITGCNIVGQGVQVKPLYIGTNHSIDQTRADVAKQIVISMEEVIEVKGVGVDEDIYIATKVKHFDRFFLDQIRKNAHNKVKKRFPNANVHISTDKKVFLELEKLEGKMYQNTINKEDIEKEIKRIERFMKG